MNWKVFLLIITNSQEILLQFIIQLNPNLKI